MRVALDATPLLGDRTGVGTFTAGVLYALARRPELEVVGYAMSGRRHVDLAGALPAGVVTGRRLPAGPAMAAWAHGLRWPGAETLAGGVAVVHGTNFVVPPSRRAGRVVTVHDLTAVRFPEMCTPTSLRYPDLIERALNSGAWVHTPSAFVASEVVEHFGAPAERVRAVAHGVGFPMDRGAADVVSPARAALAARPYVLSLGTAEPRKDLPMLVRAWSAVAARRPDLCLVLAGPEGWGADALAAAIDASAARERIIRIGWVHSGARAALLREAAAYASSAIYEGFGLPALEAMAAGIPVAATAAGAVPEVVGDAAALVAVGDEAGFADALERVLDDPTGFVAAGRARAEGFTWQACAEALAALYRDAA